MQYIHTYVHMCGLFSLCLNRIDESMCEEDILLPKEGIMEPSGQYIRTYMQTYRASCACMLCMQEHVISIYVNVTVYVNVGYLY